MQTLHGAVIGYGVAAQGHLEGYLRQWQLVVDAIVDVSSVRRAAATTALPGVRVYPDLDEALSAERLDFLDICTPPWSHLDQIVRGLDVGLLVLCEKPLLMGTAEIPRLRRALDGSTGTVYPCHNYTFAPAVAAINAVLLEGGGTPVRGHFRIVRTGHARGVDEWDRDWRRDPAVSGGGILRDHGPHCIYVAQRLVGAPVTGVSCRVRHPDTGPWSSTEDAVELNLQLGDVTIRVELSWVGASRQTTYEIETDRGRLRLVENELRTEVDGVARLVLVPSGFDNPGHGSWFAALLADVCERRNNATAMEQLLDEALMTLRVIEAAYESAGLDGLFVAVATSVSAEAVTSGG